MQFIKKFIKNEKGATAIEYGLIAALIAVAAIVGMRQVSASLNGSFARTSTALDAVK